MKQTKCNLNLWPYAITATVIFAVFKMNGTIDWSWFKVLLPVIVYTVLAVVAALVIIAVSLYKVKRDFKKTLEEQLAAAEEAHLAEIIAARKKLAEEFSLERTAECNECKQREDSIELSEDMKNGKTPTPTSKAD